MNDKIYVLKKSLLLKTFLCFLFILSSFNQYAQQTDSLKKLTPNQWTRPRKIDVKHIALDLKFDWSKKQAFGTATLTLSPLNPTNSINLDAGMLSISSIVSLFPNLCQ